MIQMLLSCYNLKDLHIACMAMPKILQKTKL